MGEVRQGGSLNIHSIHSKGPLQCKRVFAGGVKGNSQKKNSKSFSVEVSSGVICTSVCMKLQKGGMGKGQG